MCHTGCNVYLLKKAIDLNSVIVVPFFIQCIPSPCCSDVRSSPPQTPAQSLQQLTRSLRWPQINRLLSPVRGTAALWPGLVCVPGGRVSLPPSPRPDPAPPAP